VSWQQRIDEAVKKRLNANEPIWTLISSIKKDRSLREATKDRYLSELYNCLSDKDIHQSIVVDTIKYEVGMSFRSSLNHLRRIKDYMHQNGTEFFPADNNKNQDRAFGKLLGMPVPKTYQSGVRLDQIRLLPKSFLKPLIGSSSMAVFYVDEGLALHSIKTGNKYGTLTEAGDEIQRFDKHISGDHWLLEEAVMNGKDRSANDFKVFSFYGEIGMFLEINRTSSETPRYATYDASGRQIIRNPRELTFRGSGVPSALYEMSKKISLAAPIPFLRIDFHLGVDDLYLGEITPQPGGMHADRIYEELDRALGRCFGGAEARLYLDLLRGKRFPEFQEAYIKGETLCNLV